ncbi:hypothetical protein [Spirillospora sp. NPDC047279]|uniref:hypothetical protein n=1 Tax=Spirillospora sp. NPDC047279 TaxID=3155478 RepID=UPI0033FA4C71
MLGTTVKLALAGTVLAGALTGCGDEPLRMGAAALVGGDRISTSTLDQAVLDCQKQFRADQVANQVRAALESQRQAQPMGTEAPDCSTRNTLDMMVNFEIAEAATKAAGVSVTETQVDEMVGLMSRQAPAESIVVAIGLPKAFTRDFAKMQKSQELILRKFGADGDQQSPATLQSQQQTVALLRNTADKLSIKINPRFGSFDKNRITITPVTTRLSAVETGVH